jgi:hypothetical protein
MRSNLLSNPFPQNPNSLGTGGEWKPENPPLSGSVSPEKKFLPVDPNLNFLRPTHAAHHQLWKVAQGKLKVTLTQSLIPNYLFNSLTLTLTLIILFNLFASTHSNIKQNRNPLLFLASNSKLSCVILIAVTTDT